MSKITPKAISGFPEWSPEQKLVESRFLSVIRKHYEGAGFTPIETPTVEMTEVLTSKGGSEKEIYSLTRLHSVEDGDDDNKKLSLHFDLTVPLARYVAMRYNDLSFPFRRSQIQKVWRGERPQAGRFREFYQCDIDVIGNGSLSHVNDAEIPSIINNIFTELNIGRFLIRINNRKILQGYLSYLGVTSEKFAELLRVIDKIEKIGREEVVNQLVNDLSVEVDIAEKVLQFVELKVVNGKLKESLEKISCDNEIFLQGVNELSFVVESMSSLGVPTENYVVDLSIARGLDYYTGTVYEAILVDNPKLGSICSGGRYENLASHFTDKNLPGVGISIGLTRLLSKLFALNIVDTNQATTSKVLFTTFDDIDINTYFSLARKLREVNIACEVYTEGKKLGDQMKYADKKGIQLAVICGKDEIDKKVLSVKFLATGKIEEVQEDDFVQFMIKSLK